MNKKLISVAAAGCMILNASVFVMAQEPRAWVEDADVSWFSGEENFYSINSASELAGLAKLVNEGNTFQGITISLDSDIVLNEGSVEYSGGKYSFVTSDGGEPVEWTPIGTFESSRSRGFRGKFEGNRHSISGMYINSDEGDVGLFGISYGCEINELRVENSLVVTKKGNAGSIISGVPEAAGSTITISLNYCSSDAVVTDNGEAAGAVYLGGIIGSGKTNVASRNIKFNVQNTFFEGKTLAMSDGFASYAGGIVGRGGRSDSIALCYNAGEVKGAAAAAGICALPNLFTAAENCYNTGAVTAEYAGGIFGDYSSAAPVKNSFNIGKISADFAGGIAARGAENAEYSNNFYLDTSADYAYMAGSEKTEDAAWKAERMSEAHMKSSDVIEKLNRDGAENFVLSNESGFPVLRDLYYRNLFLGKYEVSNLRIEGESKLGEELNACFDFTGLSEAVKYIKYQWMTCPLADGEYIDIDGATEKALPVTKEINDRYIKIKISLPTGGNLVSEPFYLNVYDTSFKGEISDLKVRGILKAGNTLYFGYNSENVGANEIFAVEWLEGASADGSFESVGAENSFETADTNQTKYYKVKITLINGKEYTSSAAAVAGHPTTKGTAVDNESTKFETVNQTTPAEYVFTVGGQDFILLDTEENSDSGRFLVLAKSSNSKYGSVKLNEFNEQSLLEKLPEELTKYIDATSFWWGSTDAWGAYRQGYKKAVYVPSLDEVKKYSARIGLADEGFAWWTRTNAAMESNGSNWFIINAEEGKVGTTGAADFKNASAAVRPIFRLGLDFFKNVRLDVQTIGSGVMEAIKANYEKSELLGVYSQKELEELFGFADDYKIVSAEFFENGELVETLTADAFSADIVVKSNVARANVRILAAVYKESGELIDIKYSEVLMDEGEEKNLELVFSDLEAGGKTVKITVLGNDNMLAPLSSYVIF